ncbi:MAG: hypothetical protein M1832_002731 [Thelocarpon impressellum]|nr:MAG: hypothetical protein M1832_002731 [Thelocarpon impressellum]
MATVTAPAPAPPSLTELNRQHWDSATARSFDDIPWIREASALMSTEILARKDRIHPGLTDKTARVLDYACGQGDSSLPLAPYGAQFRGLDLSERMAAAYNAKAAAHGFDASFMSATAGDLVATPPSAPDTPEYRDFDLALVRMAFHHFENIDTAAARLVERLKRGSGVLVVVDFLPHEDIGGGHVPKEFAAAANTISHSGFFQETIEQCFARAGCVDVQFEMMTKVKIGEAGDTERDVFICWGRRADDGNRVSL